MIRTRSFLLIFLIFSIANGFKPKDKFIKNYMVMKLYQSCFGPETVLQVRNEIREAGEKCSNNIDQDQSSFEKPSTEQPKHQNNAPSYENAKFNPTIIAYRPSNSFPNPMFNPDMYGTNPNHAGPIIFSSPFQQPNGFAPVNPYIFPFLSNRPYFTGHRTARENKNWGTPIDSVTSVLGPSFKNLTCVMQELGYVDENFRPSYEKIKSRIDKYPVDQFVKDHIKNGVDMCKKLSLCINNAIEDENVSDYDDSMANTLFFLKCYKGRKLEACVLNDIKRNEIERFGPDEDLEDINRNSREAKIRDETDSNTDKIAAALHNFLFENDVNLSLDEYF